MKTLWITAVNKDEQLVQALIATAKKYGLGANGHFWQDDLKKMAWLAVSKQLQDKAVSLWVIVIDESALTPEVRYGLTLLTMVSRQQRPELPILILDTSASMDSGSLPGIFADTPMLASNNPSLGAKFAAMANMPAKKVIKDYRFTVHANPGFGVWFEVGPTVGAQWLGSIFGVNQGEIKAHGIGPSGVLPEKCTLEYPIQGMKLESGTDTFIAWGVKNKLEEKDSYYVKVEGTVSSILFGMLPEDDTAEVHVLKM